jgi:hypothetical protein
MRADKDPLAFHGGDKSIGRAFPEEYPFEET